MILKTIMKKVKDLEVCKSGKRSKTDTNDPRDTVSSILK